MDGKWGLRSRDRENVTISREPIAPPKKDNAPVMSLNEEYRASLKREMEREVETVLDGEIRKAAQELIQEQWRMIRETAEEHKKIIRDVVAEERAVFRARVEEFKRSLATLSTE